MEQECVAGLYQSLGLSLGGEFSLQDVCVLFHKVFHLPSSTGDAHAAIQRVAGSGESRSCSGRNLLDVLLEMERERERREELYWDVQLLNVGEPEPVSQTDAQMTLDQALNNRKHSSMFIQFPQHAQCGADHAIQGAQGGVLAGGTDWWLSSGGRVWRLRRAARQSWARLVAEGVRSVLPSVSERLGLGVTAGSRGGAQSSGVTAGSSGGAQSCGLVPLSELLLLVEEKYGIVTHVLYTDMLQEHLGQDGWESLLPWQQEEREAELGQLTEEALESGDLLRLCDLPGAFRIYRSHEGVSLRGCPDWVKPREESWSAISLLAEIHAFQQQERNTLTALSKRLDPPTLRLLCLYLRLAALRARREELARGALLAARQSWETWPCVRSPCCDTEQAKVWLQMEEREGEGEGEEPALPVSSQQAVLHCMVQSQEQERKCLLGLLHGVSLEDLQGPGPQMSSGEEPGQQRAALRDACVRRIRHAILQTHTQEQSPQRSPQLAQGSPQLPPPGRAPGGPAGPSSQPGWGAWALVLLTQLMELQEARVSAVLPTLLDMSELRLQALRKEYERELREQRLTCLLTLLTSDNHSNTPLTPDPCALGHSEPITAQNNATADPIMDWTSRDPGQAHINGNRERQDLCTGCGMTLEDLPYLEILCVPDAYDSSNARQANTHPSIDGRTAEGGDQQGGEDSPRKSFEKQDSLITMAWSRPPEGATEPQVAATVMSSAAEEQQVEECSVHHTPGQKRHSDPSGDPARDSDPSGDPARDSDPSGDPAGDSDPSGDPARDSDPSGDPAGDSDPSGDPAGDSDPSGDPARDSDPSGDPAGDSDPSGDPAGDSDPLGDARCEKTTLDSSLFQSSSKAGPPHSQEPAGQLCIARQIQSADLEEGLTVDQPAEREEDLPLDLHTHAEHTGAPEAPHTHRAAGVPEEGRNDLPVDEVTDELTAAAANECAYLGAMGGYPADWEACCTETEPEPWSQSGLAQSASGLNPQNTAHTAIRPGLNPQNTTHTATESNDPESVRMKEPAMRRERTREPVSVMEREETMRSLVDMQRKVEQKQQRDRERQLLRVQERLSIIQNRKSEEDLMGLKQGDRLRHLTHNLPQEDKSHQKTVVRERLAQLSRERSYVLQSKRDRNTAGFKELLSPVASHGADTEDGTD